MKKNGAFTINGSSRQMTVDDERTRLWFLRIDPGLTGREYGGGEGYCGSCTMRVDGEAVRSCQTPVKDIEGKEVITIEGLASNGNLHLLLKAFMAHDALQCGYCTPGTILSAYALLQKNPNPTEDDIKKAIDGNLCRCTGYVQQIEAVKRACELLKEEANGK